MPQEMGFGRPKESLEKYYTYLNTIAVCMHTLQGARKINKMKDRVIEPIEPSAGCGAWIPALKGVCDDCHFYDLHPEHVDVKKQNWFDYEEDDKSKGKTFVIGNPPFGKNSPLAEQFIQHAAKIEADYIAFILPLSYLKTFGNNRGNVPANYHVIAVTTLPKDSFTVGNVPKDVPSCFVVWEKREEERATIVLPEPTFYNHLSTVGPKQSIDKDADFEDADFAIHSRSNHMGKERRMFRVDEKFEAGRSRWHLIKLKDESEEAKDAFEAAFFAKIDPFPEASLGVGAPTVSNPILREGLNALKIDMDYRLEESRGDSEMAALQEDMDYRLEESPGDSEMAASLEKLERLRLSKKNRQTAAQLEMQAAVEKHAAQTLAKAVQTIRAVIEQTSIKTLPEDVHSETKKMMEDLEKWLA